jgi:hypothetical protein
LPPTVLITRPTAGFIARPSEILASGRITAPGGLKTFCVVANTPAFPPFGCDDASLVKPDGTFTDVAVRSATVPGPNRLTAYVRDLAGQDVSASVVVELPNGLDLRATSLEVNQSIQRFGLPLNTGPVPYVGVKLVRGATTIVRAYANAFATGRAAGSPIPAVPAVLEGTRNGVALPGSPLSPESGPRALFTGPPLVSLEEVANPNSGFTFRLPLEWTTGGPIQLRSVINPQTVASSITESNLGNNRFTLTGVAFEARYPITISPVKVVYTDPADTSKQRVPGPASAVFAQARNIAPLGDDQLNIPDYRGVINVSDVFALTEDLPLAQQREGRHIGLFERVAYWEGMNNAVGTTMGIVTGYSDYAARGREAPVFYPGCAIDCPRGVEGPRFEEIAYANDEKPLGSIAHEWWHTLHYFHAGHRCASGFPTDYPYVHWDPDDQGFIQGMGLDRRQIAGQPGVYRRVIAGSLTTTDRDDQLPEYYDVMSYCALDPALWVSTRTWDTFTGGLLPLGVPIPGDSTRIRVRRQRQQPHRRCGSRRRQAATGPAGSPVCGPGATVPSAHRIRPRRSASSSVTRPEPSCRRPGSRPPARMSTAPRAMSGPT